VGRTLQIRVSATTFDVAEVEKRWPRLCGLAFSPVAVKIPIIPEERRGVVELVEHLCDRLELGMLPDDATRELADAARKARAAREALAAHLSDWNAREANQDTDRMEEALDELEQLAKGLKSAPGLDR
jgi:hypothetical protein